MFEHDLTWQPRSLWRQPCAEKLVSEEDRRVLEAGPQGTARDSATEGF